MSYRVEVLPRARRQLRKLSQDVQKRIRKAIGGLSEEPRPPGVSKLRGYNDRWRVRVGQYRIIYEIDDQVLRVLVLTISDRSQSYTKRYR